MRRWRFWAARVGVERFRGRVRTSAAGCVEFAIQHVWCPGDAARLEAAHLLHRQRLPRSHAPVETVGSDVGLVDSLTCPTVWLPNAVVSIKLEQVSARRLPRPRSGCDIQALNGGVSGCGTPRCTQTLHSPAQPGLTIVSGQGARSASRTKTIPSLRYPNHHRLSRTMA